MEAHNRTAAVQADKSHFSAPAVEIAIVASAFPKHPWPKVGKPLCPTHKNKQIGPCYRTIHRGHKQSGERKVVTSGCKKPLGVITFRAMMETNPVVN